MSWFVLCQAVSYSIRLLLNLWAGIRGVPIFLSQDTTQRQWFFLNRCHMTHMWPCMDHKRSCVQVLSKKTWVQRYIKSGGVLKWWRVVLLGSCTCINKYSLHHVSFTKVNILILRWRGTFSSPRHGHAVIMASSLEIRRNRPLQKLPFRATCGQNEIGDAIKICLVL